MIRSCSVMTVFLAFLHLSVLSANEKADRWGVGVQPIIGYDDDAGWTLGASSAFYYNPRPEDKKQELDELGLTATYSFNGGANVHADYTKNLNGNDRSVNVVFGGEKYIEYYYGTGEDASARLKETYTTVEIPFELSYSFRILDHLYANATYAYQYLDIDGRGDDTVLSAEVMENDGLRASGLGVGVSYKTTNPGVYKRRGYTVSLSSICYSQKLGGSSSFECMGLGYRHYFPLFSKCVLGFQVNADKAIGDVPLYYLPGLGGHKILRGFQGSRYKGRNCLAAQAEFRFPVWWRCGGTVFAGLGEAADEFGDFGTRVKAAGGIGFRFAVQKKQNINVRFDLAFNSDGEVKKYIKLKEAF